VIGERNFFREKVGGQLIPAFALSPVTYFVCVAIVVADTREPLVLLALMAFADLALSTVVVRVAFKLFSLFAFSPYAFLTIIAVVIDGALGFVFINLFAFVMRACVSGSAVGVHGALGLSVLFLVDLHCCYWGTSGVISPVSLAPTVPVADLVSDVLGILDHVLGGLRVLFEFGIGDDLLEECTQLTRGEYGLAGICRDIQFQVAQVDRCR
jgi:hypothetical protein